MRKIFGILFIAINLFVIWFIFTNISNILIFLFVIFISGLLINGYGGYAKKEGWRIGLSFKSYSSFIMIAAIISIFLSFTASFFFIKWYWVIFGAIYGWLITGGITALFKENTQILSLLLFGFSLLFGLFLLLLSFVI
ncbi:MAG: hypothetical protein WCY43_02405 [Patescibacteria group bacterium]|nr:hypothetical protein [Patescibacteria group bacterium]